LGPVLRGVAAFEVGNVAVTLLILRATEVLTDSRGLERATQIALLLYLAYNLTGTLASFLAGRRIDRSGAELVLVAGVGAFAVAYVTFALVGTGILVLLLAFAVAGVGIGFVETAEHAVVAARAPEGLRGSSFGLLAFVQSIGNFAASGGAGLIWTLISPRAAFLYLACWMGLSFVLLLPTTRPLRDDALRA
jgi:MFS family permease